MICTSYMNTSLMSQSAWWFLEAVKIEKQARWFKMLRYICLQANCLPERQARLPGDKSRRLQIERGKKGIFMSQASDT